MNLKNNFSPAGIVFSLVLLSLGLLFFTPQIGLDTLTHDAIRQQVLWDIRVPRALLAFTVGCGLALSGLVFQAMFHNPLATPFTLGVASGASLGAAVSIYFGLSFTLLGLGSHTLSAFLGALLSISIVYSISRLRQRFSTETLLLSGVAISFFFSSLILLVQYLSNVADAFQIVRWLMGSLTITGYHDLLQIMPFVLLTAIIVIACRRELNLMMTGDELAISRGVSIRALRYVLFFVTSICVGAMVAICGPIGFVGMMVPHMCRLLLGSDHRWLIPASMLLGGSFLILCDVIARWLIAPAELPVGIITTLLGGPFFLWLLLRSKHRPY